MSDTRPFVFGLDLTYRSHGALALAAWLRERLGPEDVEAVHVIPARDEATRDERQQRAGAVLTERLGAAGHAQTFSRVQIREAADVVADLAHVESFGRALVLGRRARSGERALVHLGPVARKLLRLLPLPTIITPPELAPDRLGGPIVLATDLAGHSERAARFAVDLARAAGCELVLAHVADVHYNESVEQTDPAWNARLEQFRCEAAKDLDFWAEAHGLAGRRVARCGAAVEVLLDLADRERASMLVLGSRRLSATERLFTTSTSSTVAAYASCPVAVVPPPL